MNRIRLGNPPLDSERKLNAAAEGLGPWLVDDAAGRGCVPRRIAAADDEAFGYRCRCSYQVLRMDCPGEASTKSRNPTLQYAVRRNHQPVPIHGTFDARIANRRIQRAMSGLLTILNHGDEGDESSDCLQTNLTSVTFSTSWDEEECLLSMNYCPTIVEPEKWRRQAESARVRLDVLQVSGRSKNVVLRAKGATESIFLTDKLVLARDASANPHPSLGTSLGSWDVRILSTTGEDMIHSRGGESGASSATSPLLVQYEKPDSAFFHPNPSVMCQALSWILHRLDVCCSTTESPTDLRLRVLELYCGCGAHTMAILQSRLPLARVVAVENDERLTRALQRNCRLNGIACGVDRDAHPPCRYGEEIVSDRDGPTAPIGLTVVAQDAGLYVRRLARHQHSTQATQERFDLLLVDPPKQGLDASVCDFARSHATLQHVLYVSCGRDALLRDLKRLHGCFRVVDCVLLDLFPGTSAVETLVHLQRRSNPA